MKRLQSELAYPDKQSRRQNTRGREREKEPLQYTTEKRRLREPFFFFFLSHLFLSIWKISAGPPFSLHVLLGKGQELIMNDLSIAFPADGRGSPPATRAHVKGSRSAAAARASGSPGPHAGTHRGEVCQGTDAVEQRRQRFWLQPFLLLLLC